VFHGERQQCPDDARNEQGYNRDGDREFFEGFPYSDEPSRIVGYSPYLGCI